MLLEFWNTVAAIGTFLVISATAVTAIVQLRHLRGSNQIAALNELREAHQSADLIRSLRFLGQELPGLLKDPAFRSELAHVSRQSEQTAVAFSHASRVGDYFEGMGMMVEMRLVDRDTVMRQWGSTILSVWRVLEPVTAILREDLGVDTIWDRFEYLAVLAEDYAAMHPRGTYPKGVRRLPVVNRHRGSDAAP